MICFRRFALVAAFIAACSAQVSQPLKLEKTIPLPGVEGRIDHLSADIAGARLFVAALGNHSVEVLDWKSGKIVHRIQNLPEPQGVLYLPGKNRLYVTTGGDGSVRIFDARSFQLITAIKLGTDADNIRFDAAANRIYVGYGDGALATLSPEGKRLGDVPLRAHPESFQIEAKGRRTFVNLPRVKAVAVVDREKDLVVGQWGTGLASANFPMALAEAARRLFVVCRMPARLLALDTESGKVAAKLDTVGDADDVFYDAARRRVYVTGGAGTIAVYAQQGADHYEQIARLTTSAGARTSLFVPEADRLFVAVPYRGAQAAGVQVYEVQ